MKQKIMKAQKINTLFRIAEMDSTGLFESNGGTPFDISTPFIRIGALAAILPFGGEVINS